MYASRLFYLKPNIGVDGLAMANGANIVHSVRLHRPRADSTRSCFWPAISGVQVRNGVFYKTFGWRGCAIVLSAAVLR